MTLRSTSPAPLTALLCAVAAAVLALMAAAPAGAAVKVTAKGAGFGHGIGMSQYGAYGQAKVGRSATQIIQHYYRGTQITKGDPDRLVRVLLRSSSSVRVRGAASLAGSGRRLSPNATYVLKRSGGKVRLTSSKGTTLATATTAMRVEAPSGGSVQVLGRALNGVTNGRYRGAIELRGTMVINQLTLEQYLRGVVPGEIPASWPSAALQAQAIAARTYAITTAKSDAFDHYPDTRSQVYRGVTAEAGSTDLAISATAGRYVTYAGKPIPTYYFSTSGGRTENVEYSWPGAKPAPYLKSVNDPWDKVSPVHTWKLTYTKASLQRKLGGWVKGSLKSIKVVKRGVSPRIVHADVIGSRGKTRVTGPQLRARLGLRDTWVQFVFSDAKAEPLPDPSGDDDAPPAPTTPGTSQGGVSAARASLQGTADTLAAVTRLGAGMAVRAVAADHAVASGRVWPEGGGALVRLQVRKAGRWRTALRVRAGADGRWQTLVPAGKRYRPVALGAAGPVIDARR